MKRFTLLTQTRQATEYSCGASSLQAVMSYWGKDVDETELMTLLGTTPEDGTYPEDIVRVAQALGFHAELKSHLTIDDIKRATDRGEPVLVLGQLWLSDEKLHDNSFAEEWDCGHWFIALAVDDNYIYFQDPYVRMGKGFMPREQFEERWHNVMGGDRNKPEQIRMAIFIRGDKPAQQQLGDQKNQSATTDFSGLEQGKVGSLNFMVTQFPGPIVPLDFMEEIKEILSSGLIRHDAIIFLHRDTKGRVTAIEGGGVQTDDDITEVNAIIGALIGLIVDKNSAHARALLAAENADTDFGLSVEELHRIADQLPSNHSAIIVLFENLWELKFRALIKQRGGTLVNHRLIGPNELNTLGSLLRDLSSKKALSKEKANKK